MDYLIFRVYLNQIFIFFLIIFYYKYLVVYKKEILTSLVVLGFFILVSNNPSITLLYILRRIIYIPFLFLLFRLKEFKPSFKFLISLNILYLTVLVLQFLFNSNIFSYFPFGFYPFHGVGVRLDYLSWFGIKRVIPLGNFPHPNVFAAFLSLLNTAYLSLFFKSKNKNNNYILILFIFNITACLLLGSLTALLFNFLLVTYFLYINNKFKILPFILIFISLFYISYLGSFKITSVNSRVDQIKSGYYLIKKAPIIGVGVGNYIPSILEYENFIGGISDLQPVHNIFILYFVETGFFGLITLLYYLFKYKNFLKLTPFLLFIIVFSASDHFLITLNQGLLMLTLTIFMHKSIIKEDA